MHDQYRCRVDLSVCLLCTCGLVCVDFVLDYVCAWTSMCVFFTLCKLACILYLVWARIFVVTRVDSILVDLSVCCTLCGLFCVCYTSCGLVCVCTCGLRLLPKATTGCLQPLCPV